MVNENHTFGAYYKYDRTPSSETKGDYLTDMFENGILTEHSASYIWQDKSVKKHIFNAYYNGKAGQLGIDLNIDGLFDDTKTPGHTTEQTTVVDATPVDRDIESNTNSANNFWASKGDYNNFSITAQRFDLTLGVQRDFNLRRLGMLTLDVRCVDVLNTNKTDATLYGIRELSVQNPARRTFLVNLTWKFNEARSKYRGSGAGEKQKARM
jgi:hypothetical protein